MVALRVVVRRPWVSCGEMQAAWGGFGWPVKAIGELWHVQATSGWACEGEVCTGEPEARWVSCVGFVSAWKWGKCCMWWCGGRVWDVKRVWAACRCHGGHGVHVDYLWVVYVLWGRCGLHVVAMVAMGCMWTTYGLCMGCIYKYVVVVFMIIDPYKFMVGYCNKILHKVRLSTRPIPLTASCFLPQEKWHPNPKTKSFPFVSLPTNYNFAFTIQYLFEFCFHFYNACKKFLSTYLTPTVQI